MRILLVHNFYQQPGGEDQVFTEEAAMLEKRGHTVGQFVMHNDAIDAGMGKLELARKTVWNSASAGSLRQAVRDIRAEIVHFHNTFPLVSPAGYYAAHEEGAAVVQTLHNYRLLCPAATFYRGGQVCEDCMGTRTLWPSIVHRCYRNSRMATTVLATMLGYHRLKGTWQNEVDVYIALTEFSRQKFIEGGLPEDKIVVKPNFVDPDPGAGRGEGEYAIFVGRLTDEKGVATLVNAWKPLYQNWGLKLKIIGDGPLRELVISAAGGETGIEFLGRRSSAEVYDMMGSARVMVFPSQWYEGLPRTIIESLAKGTPVLASRLGSMPELVDHERNGFLFCPGDGNDLRVQMTKFLSRSPGEHSQIRQAARATYETAYTAEKNYPKLIDCYERAATGLTTRRNPAARSAVRMT